MQVTFKLFATLMSYLPGNASKNAVSLDIHPDTSVQGLIDQYKLPEKEVHLVLLNGIFVSQEDRQKVLSDGDTLAIWPPVAGG
jgi:molybdopterin converting factor small subunit